jgi:anti-sigma factor RsiW
MNCERIEPALDDYMDGDLSGERLREVEQHVATCAGCKTALARRRSLACAAAELRRGVAPARDLWPGIRDAIVAGKGETAERPQPPTHEAKSASS